MLPNLIVIGAQKCATSSLHQYLAAHPDIFMSQRKELNFFVAEKEWPQGLDWYRAHFPEAAKVRGESSPNYTTYPFFAGVAERMHAALPDARLIYVVRDPIERMLSQYAHAVERYNLKRPAGEVLLDPEGVYQARSRYFLQLQEYLRFYDKSAIMVVEYEALAADRPAMLRRIFEFLGVDPDFTSPAFDQVYHSSAEKRRLNPLGSAMRKAYHSARRLLPAAGRLARLRQSKLLSRKVERPLLSESERARLREHLADDVAQLRAFTGLGLESWSV
ncbi:MAG TPA: sulfotransferase [Allosphingosinicella sp.]|jgi:hypothetical protein|nr:sulfotransferase [Allosphingosinicella sp.]